MSFEPRDMLWFQKFGAALTKGNRPNKERSGFIAKVWGTSVLSNLGFARGSSRETLFPNAQPIYNNAGSTSVGVSGNDGHDQSES